MDGGVGEGRDEADDVGAGAFAGLDAGAAVLEDDAVGGGDAEPCRGLEVAVGVGLAGAEVLRGEDGVEAGREVGMAAVDVLHLGEITARDDGRADAAAAEAVQIRFKAGNVGEVHFRLEGVEEPDELLAILFVGPGEPGVHRGDERRALDGLDHFRRIGPETRRHLRPEPVVLRLRIEDNSV